MANMDNNPEPTSSAKSGVGDPVDRDDKTWTWGRIGCPEQFPRGEFQLAPRWTALRAGTGPAGHPNRARGRALLVGRGR